jgi:hypothetical protein
MNEAYTGGWTTHSNEVITRVAEQLTRQQGEMLILERNAFAPGSWEEDDNRILFGVPEWEPSHLEDLERSDNGDDDAATLGGGRGGGRGLDDDDDDEGDSDYYYDEWDGLDAQQSEWIDWSRTYLLHAFNPGRFGVEVDGFEHITPRYVLERRSNFARAVYPVARELFDQGIISVDDSHISEY